MASVTSACPACGAATPVAEALNAAVLTVSSELRLEPVLARLAGSARELVDARYAAIGIPDGEGGFASFVTTGMSAAQLEALGELPRTHGLLGAMLEQPEPFRTDDIQRDPRFEGWPEAHPSMHSFLGVPIVANGEVVGAFYLTEKRGQRRGTFTDADREVVQMLAQHAGLALTNARLLEESRELSVVEERKRLARDLHDSVCHSLQSVIALAEGGARLANREPEAAQAELRRVAELARGAMSDMRALVFELRPAALEEEGLVPALRKHADVLTRVHGIAVDVTADDERRLDPAVEHALFRIVQEALGNAVKHAECRRASVGLALGAGGTIVTITDDGCGFDPEHARRSSGRLGLTSMRERADAIDAVLNVVSRPGAGTTVSIRLG